MAVAPHSNHNSFVASSRTVYNQIILRVFLRLKYHDANSLYKEYETHHANIFDEQHKATIKLPNWYNKRDSAQKNLSHSSHHPSLLVEGNHSMTTMRNGFSALTFRMWRSGTDYVIMMLFSREVSVLLKQRFFADDSAHHMHRYEVAAKDTDNEMIKIYFMHGIWFTNLSERGPHPHRGRFPTEFEICFVQALPSPEKYQIPCCLLPRAQYPPY